MTNLIPLPLFRQLVLISFRNIFRSKRRSLLTLLVMAAGSTSLILIGGYFINLMDGLREKYIHSQLGHLQINVKGYDEKGATDPFAYFIKDVARIQGEIEMEPHVQFTVPRLKINGLVSSDETSIPVMVLGVDPARETRMGNFKYENAKQSSISITEGKDLDNSAPSEAILGKGLQKALDLKEGDTFTLVTTREQGALDGGDYSVRGSFETPVKEFDDHTLKINLSEAQKLLGITNQVQSLLVILDDTKNTDLVKKHLEEKFSKKGDNLEIITWEQQGDYYRKSKALFDKIFTIVQFIIGIIFFLSIANTITMSLFERTKEFGTMMALGNGRWTIFVVIAIEAVGLGFIGALTGLITGVGMACLVSAIGIEMPPPPQATMGYYAMITVTPGLLVSTTLITISSTLLASLIPAYRACHLRILDALGYV